MFELFERVIARLRNVWDGMSLNQRVISGAVIVAILGVGIFLTTFSTAITDWTVIFAELEPSDASQITSRLDQDNIPFLLTNNGTAIEVPAEMADRLRIDLTAEGMPQSGIVGYELLDTTNFGMSDYLLKKNYQRAIMGELRKTLRSLDEVRDASVMIHVPEPELFAEQEEPPTASIVLHIERNRNISKRSIEALTNLVGSATGIDPGNVTIVDGRGNLLTAPVRDDLAFLSSTQLEQKSNTDRYYARKVSSMLEKVFGTGGAIVNVDAELDFARLERVTTSYNQQQSGIVSEDRTEITNPTAEGGGEERTVTNYELGNTIENYVSSPGTVTKLTVSVMIDGRDTTWVDDDGARQFDKIPWTQVQLDQIRELSETAVGYNEERGDRIVVAQMPFESRDPDVADEEGFVMQGSMVEILKVFGVSLAIIAAFVFLFVILRQISSQLDPEKIALKTERLLEREKRDIVEDEEIESERGALIQRIVSRSVKDPDTAAKALRTLYRE